MRMILAGLMGLAAAGCSIAEAQEGAASSGSGGERSYQVGGFTRIAVAGAYDVEVVRGAAPAVRASGDSDALDRLVVRVEGDTLHIEPRRQSGMSWSRGSARVFVTAPRIQGASLAGSGDIRIDQADGDAFSGSIAGSGDMALGRAQVGRLNASIAGSGSFRAAGQAGTTELRIVGSGDIDAGGLAARTADLRISGSGNARINASETANVSIAGSGDVDVTGGARCTVRRAGSGEVRCG